MQRGDNSEVRMAVKNHPRCLFKNALTKLGRGHVRFVGTDRDKSSMLRIPLISTVEESMPKDKSWYQGSSSAIELASDQRAVLMNILPATYQGAGFIWQKIESVLKQITPGC
jgi:hypothetical protein